MSWKTLSSSCIIDDLNYFHIYNILYYVTETDLYDKRTLFLILINATY